MTIMLYKIEVIFKFLFSLWCNAIKYRQILSRLITTVIYMGTAKHDGEQFSVWVHRPEHFHLESNKIWNFQRFKYRQCNCTYWTLGNRDRPIRVIPLVTKPARVMSLYMTARLYTQVSLTVAIIGRVNNTLPRPYNSITLHTNAECFA